MTTGTFSSIIVGRSPSSLVFLFILPILTFLTVIFGLASYAWAWMFFAAILWLNSPLTSCDDVLCEVNSLRLLLSLGYSNLCLVDFPVLVGIVNLLFSSIYQFGTRIDALGIVGSNIAALVTGPLVTFALVTSRRGRSRLSGSTGSVDLSGVSLEACYTV